MGTASGPRRRRNRVPYDAVVGSSGCTWEMDRAMPQHHKQGSEQSRETAAAKTLTRRMSLALLAAVPLAIAWELAGNGRSSDASDAATAASGAGNAVAIMEFSDDGQSKGVVMVSKVAKTDDQWHKLLTPE